MTFFLTGSLLPANALAHGSVTPDEDLCLIRIGYYTAHFKIYLPETHGHRQFCEDLPDAGSSLFVMEYIHDGLANAPIEFRIIKNITGQGRFTRLQHIEALDDLEQHTVYLHPPARQADVFTVLHEIAEPGEYVGVVKVPSGDGKSLHTAVFPFEAGSGGLGWWPWLALAALLLQLNYLWMIGWFNQRSWRGLAPRAWFPVLGAAALFASLPGLTAADPTRTTSHASANDLYRLSYEVELQPLTINRIHRWTLTLTDADGNPIEAAEIRVSGGMPAHDHGLPTKPRVTRNLGGGRYVLEGMRFHMHGRWHLVFHIEASAGADRLVVELDL